MKTLPSQVKEVNKAIGRELESFPNTPISVKGLGPVYTAAIIADRGGIEGFPSSGCFARFCALVDSF